MTKSQTINHVSSTGYERRSLDKINLSDGHTRQPLTSSQLDIVLRSPEIFKSALETSQFKLEEEFIDAFLTVAGQSRHYDYERYLLSYSASSAIKMIAGYCRKTGKTVALVEPTFDNIHNILRYEDVPLSPLPEEWLNSSDLKQKLQTITDDVIWLILPNNPTGSFIDERIFTLFVDFCITNHKMLVCDFCFRFFCKSMSLWDQYSLLKSSGVTFVAIEDTGKTWATLDMKLGITICSDDVYSEMYQQHDDLLLNVSPFHLKLLTEFLNDTLINGISATILYYVEENRNLLRQILQGSVLEPTNQINWAVTMEWVKINAAFSGEDLYRALLEHKIHILPGSNFYWNVPAKGRNYIRIPLTRDRDLIEKSARIIRRVAQELAKS